jgi:phytoene/squalene synthetase
MSVEISGSKVNAYTYDRGLEKNVPTTPTEEMLDFARRLKNINYTTDSDKLDKCVEKVVKIAEEKKEVIGLGIGYMTDNTGNLYVTEIGVVLYHEGTDDLEKLVNEVFQNTIFRHIKWDIYLANIEGENILLECKEGTVVLC